MNNSLSKKDVRSMFTSTTYSRGLSYFNQGRVRDLLFDTHKNAWTALVSGTRNYQVIVKVNTGNGKIQRECNCPAYESYSDCKHICAVLLKLAGPKSERSGIVTKSVAVKPKQNQYEAPGHPLNSFKLKPTPFLLVTCKVEDCR